MSRHRRRGGSLGGGGGGAAAATPWRQTRVGDAYQCCTLPAARPPPGGDTGGSGQTAAEDAAGDGGEDAERLAELSFVGERAKVRRNGDGERPDDRAWSTEEEDAFALAMKVRRGRRSA